MSDKPARAVLQHASGEKPAVVPQHVRALERANVVRCSRARLRRDVAMGRRSAAEVILNPPAEALRATIGELLTWQRGWGSVRVERFLVALGVEGLAFVSVVRALQDVTPRERLVIAERLREEFAGRSASTGVAT
jgi:hypothetical protein